ncbi:hypothetical protein NKH18_07490 [Streptomyces sp. M10(2022)]
MQAYRVLNAEGRIADGFRWAGPQPEGEDVRARLNADGIHFTQTGAADPAQRLTSSDLALLLADPDQEQSSEGTVAAGRDGAEPEGRPGRAVLPPARRGRHPETVGAVRTLLARWEELGGWVGYGAGQVTTSAFLMLGAAGLPGAGIWPLVLYPGGGRGGSAEVVFQYLATREPFTDRLLRAELLGRINGLEGVDIPEGSWTCVPTSGWPCWRRTGTATRWPRP